MVGRRKVHLSCEWSYMSSTLSIKPSAIRLRCVCGAAWENSAAELQQVKGCVLRGPPSFKLLNQLSSFYEPLSIGPVLMETLEQAGIYTIDDLSRTSVERIQLLINRNSGQAERLIQDARRFPRFNVSVKELQYTVKKTGVESIIEILVDLRHEKKELRKLKLKDKNNQFFHIAVLITTTNPAVSERRWFADKQTLTADV